MFQILWWISLVTRHRRAPEGGAAYGVREFALSDQSLGDYGRLGVSGLSSYLTYTPEPISTLFGLGIGVTDAAGGFNGFYNYLDFSQGFYNSTGKVYIPYPY